MAKRRKSPEPGQRQPEPRRTTTFRIKRPVLWSLGGFAAISALLTFPLIFRMNSSVYGFYDHVSTDLFAAIHYYFWYIKYSIIDLKSSPVVTGLFAAPFGTRMNLINMTGYIMLPVTWLWGYLASYNLTILLNLVLSGLGMFLLVRHITKSAAAGFVAGLIFAFNPNMMVRSYTTFDTTQVQWLPLYTLFLIRFMENRTWLNALMTALFLCCVMTLAIPYYLVYLPVYTVTVVAAYAGWRVWGEKRGFGGLASDIATPEALKGWLKIGAALTICVVVFLAYYTVIVGGGEYTGTVQRTTADLSALSLSPLDYLMPHPRSAFLGGNIKAAYWDTMRPGKDPDSFVAYIGLVALGLAVYGFIRGRRKPYAWIFLTAGAVAFISTLGPSLMGIPTPSGLIHAIYAHFARRILIYKIFVQLGIAGLAGIGAAHLAEKMRTPGNIAALTAALAAAIIFEYSLVPPALSVNLTVNPEIYEVIRGLPEDSTVIEVPLRRNNGNLYQGYVYYQTVHHKPLFNPYYGLSRVPERLRPFYERMAVPLEAQEYTNLSALRWLGVDYLTYHWYIGTTTVIFRAFYAPGYIEETVDGVNRVFASNHDPREGTYISPFDYTFADLYEITAEPSPVALAFDYPNPYSPSPGVLQQDGMLPCGWASALYDTTSTFYYPVAEGDRLVRLLRQGGRIGMANMSDEPAAFSLRFMAAAGGGPRKLTVTWNGEEREVFDIGVEPVTCTVEGLVLDAAGTGELRIWSDTGAYRYELADVSNQPVPIPVSAELSDFRVIMQP